MDAVRERRARSRRRAGRGAGDAAFAGPGVAATSDARGGSWAGLFGGAGAAAGVGEAAPVASEATAAVSDFCVTLRPSETSLARAFSSLALGLAPTTKSARPSEGAVSGDEASRKSAYCG